MIKPPFHSMIRSLHAAGVAGLLCLATLPSVAAQADLDGETVKTPRHTIQLAPTGLPASLAISAHESEIPLPDRGGDVPEAVLRRIGRGTQLNNARLSVQIGENVRVAEPAGNMKTRQKNDSVVVGSRLEAGDVTFDVDIEYTGAGAMFGTVAYSARGVDVKAVSLQMDLLGSVDFVMPVSPSDPVLRDVPAVEFLPVDAPQGTIWQNAGEFVEKRKIVSKGLLKHVFVGNGDRGFTWLTDGDGFDVTGDAPFCELARNEDGDIVWTLNIVNHETTLNGKTKASFAILTHPAVPVADVSRSDLWFNAPRTVGEPTTPEISLKERQGTEAVDGGVVRADAATVYEAAATMNVLTGPAGGQGESVQKDLSATFPLPLFRYYAGSHTSLPGMLRSNSGDLTRAGNTPKPDRMVLGRALLHDISADITKLAHVVSTGKLMKAMEEFGFFKNDGKTEFIPYWRSGEYIRYGEEFTGDQFAVTAENPVGNVYEVIYRRPVEGEPGRYKAMIFVVNETDENQSEQFYLFNAEQLLGASNSLEIWPYLAKKYWQEDLIPPNSDWRKDNTRVYVVGRSGNESLIDMEGEGRVRRAAKDGNLEIYGPLFVPAHDFRVFEVSGETSDREND